MKKLGNYNWRYCEKCGEKYVVCNGCKKHICKEEIKTENKIIKVIKRIFK